MSHDAIEVDMQRHIPGGGGARSRPGAEPMLCPAPEAGADAQSRASGTTPTATFRVERLPEGPTTMPRSGGTSV